MPKRAVHAARTSASDTGASFAPSDKLEWMGGRPREMLGIEGLLYKDRSFMLPWWLLLAKGPYGETSPSCKTFWYMYFKLIFRHLFQFFRQPSYLHEDTGYLILLASSEHISKDRRKAENLPPVSVYFCLQLGKVEHWQHWVGNLGLSLGCYLMCQLKIKKKSPSNNGYYL